MEKKVKPADFTSRSTMAKEDGAFQFTFFCDLCETGHATRPVNAASVKEAFDCARREARQYFNRCHCCHKWVCDGHYNEDVMMCTDCAPRNPNREE